MKIDMHVHISENDHYIDDTVKYISEAKRKGLDGFCITDHDAVALGKEAEAIGREYDFLVLVGCEYSSCDGHLLIYGLGDDEYVKTLKTAQEIIDAVGKSGIVIPSHPFSHSFISLRDGIYNINGLVALEAINGSCERYMNDMAIDAQKRLEIKGIGGSDAHCSRKVGNAYTVFEKEIRTVAELLEELRNGNYYPEYNKRFFSR